jgi:hypothetical protein
MKKSLISLGVVAVLLAGCAGMSDTQPLSGSTTGMVNGAAIGAIAGEAGWGAVTGPGGRGQ